MTRRFFFTAAGCGAALAARNWERAGFPEWSDEFVDKLLTDSPWARPATVPFYFSAPARRPQAMASEFYQIGEPLGFPKGWPGSTTPSQSPGARVPRIDDGNAPPVKTEVYLTTRWATALPVRQAMALQMYGRGGLRDARAEKLLRGEEAEYVVEIAGFPVGMAPQGVRRMEAQLAESATVTVKGRKPVHATAASVPEHGNHLMATLRFPRMENLSAEDGLIEVYARAGAIEMVQKFKLREMIYRGRLEL